MCLSGWNHGTATVESNKPCTEYQHTGAGGDGGVEITCSESLIHLRRICPYTSVIESSLKLLYHRGTGNIKENITIV